MLRSRVPYSLCSIILTIHDELAKVGENAATNNRRKK